MEEENVIKKQKKKKRTHSKTKNSNEDDNIGTDESIEITKELNSEIESNVNIAESSRRHSESDSDEPKKKKKKKKKNQEGNATTSNSKNKSIRQAKREKFAQRQAESQATAKQQIKSECLNYLSQWKHNRQNWKFMKAKQVWLYKNKFSESLVPKESWPLLLEYFESAKGNIRNMLLEDANKIIKQMDDWTESQSKQDINEEDENEDVENGESKKPNEAIYKRARELIQFLEE